MSLHEDLVELTTRHIAEAASKLHGGSHMFFAELDEDALRYRLFVEMPTAIAEGGRAIALDTARALTGDDDLQAGDVTQWEVPWHPDDDWELEPAIAARLSDSAEEMAPRVYEAVRDAADQLLPGHEGAQWVGEYFQTRHGGIARGELLVALPPGAVSTERASLVFESKLGGVAYGSALAGDFEWPLTRIEYAAADSTLTLGDRWSSSTGLGALGESEVRWNLPLARVSEWVRPMPTFDEANSFIELWRRSEPRVSAVDLRAVVGEAHAGNLGPHTVDALRAFVENTRHGELRLRMLTRLRVRMLFLLTLVLDRDYYELEVDLFGGTTRR